jgi:hypothetical protein
MTFVIIFLTRVKQVFQDCSNAKKAPSLSIDGAGDDDEEKQAASPVKTSEAIVTVVPKGYLNLGHLLMKYLIVLPKKKSDRDVYIIPYLLKAGATGIAAAEIVKKSRSELAAEIKTEKELGVTKRTDLILAAKRAQDLFQIKQMSYQLDLKAVAMQQR